MSYKDNASRAQPSLFGAAEAMPVLCKDSASRAQPSLFGVAEAMPVLCKDSANRVQPSLFGVAEAMPVLCKGKLNVRMRKIKKTFFSECQTRKKSKKAHFDFQ